DDLVLVPAQLVEVDLWLAECNADVDRVRGFVDHPARMQQRLGRNAADVEAHATEGRVALDEDRILAEVGGAERGRITAGTGTEHDDLAFDVRLAAGFRGGPDSACLVRGGCSAR